MTDGPSTKIIKLKIQSFRFFQKEESFDFEGKNALIYGENGSGKSSVFKALEILSKGKVNEKDVNIFSDEPVSITYLFDNNESEDLIINESTAIDEPFYFVKKLSVYNPFLDYKQLLKIHFSMNIGESVNILPVLKQILRSYPVEDGKVLSDITKPSEYHEKLKNILNVELIKEINDFLKLLDTDYTIESFFFDEKFVEGKSETVAILKILWKERELSQNYEGIFNEARLTAISCAIYFSAIKKLSEILEEGALKILLLDDILISLDMSNRYGLLKAIYEKFADFQIFIFTHDKVLFEYIKDMEKPGEWKNFEMYVDDRLEIEKPYVIPNIDYFQKAEKYLINRDYSACANYLRKELERLLKKSVCIQPCNDHLSLEDLVHRIEVKDVYKELAGKAQGFAKQPNIKEFAEKDESNENLKEIKGRIKTLITAVENFEKNCTNDVDAKQIIDDLMKFKNYILNPQSHDDSNKPLFKKELDETVKKINKLGLLIDKKRYENYFPERIEIPRMVKRRIIHSVFDDKNNFAKYSEFEKHFEFDLKNKSIELPENCGWYDFVMFPVKEKIRFEPVPQISDTFRPIKVGNHYSFPRTQGGYFFQDGWHSAFIEKEMVDVFSINKNGLFILREPYIEDLIDEKSRNGEKVIGFPDIIEFVTKSLMLGKQFYGNVVDNNEEIAFKWVMTETFQRLLTPPKSNRWSIASVYPLSMSHGIEIKRVFGFNELENYIELSKEIIDEIFCTFQWIAGKHYIDEFQKELIDYFKK